MINLLPNCRIGTRLAFCFSLVIALMLLVYGLNAQQATQVRSLSSEVTGAQAERLSELVASVSTAAQAQSQGIGQINLALVDLDQATQQNAALVEESAAAADSLKAQTHGLARSVQQFRLERTRV